MAGDDAGFVRITPDELVWSPLEPGIDVAVVTGDPSSDGFYIMRARFQPGTFTRPHFHPHSRHVTVIQGTWWTGTGQVEDRDHTVPLTPGSYMLHPARAPHFDGSKKGIVIVEISGIGPAAIIYVDESGNPIENVESPN
jgi:quercetin dioxygenase-like cupin family protein